MAATIAEKLAAARRRSVVWLSFQECTGCTESLTRAYQPAIEQLILGMLSLDYHHTLQAASGQQAEQARVEALRDANGAAILVIDGAIPLNDNGACCTIAGISSLQLLNESLRRPFGAAADGLRAGAASAADQPARLPAGARGDGRPVGLSADLQTPAGPG
jgi:hydrogenase small subunit